MTATPLQPFLMTLTNNLRILQEREAKYASNAPPDLLAQIRDHEQAIGLTRQALAGELSETALDEALQPLLVTMRRRAEENPAWGVTIGEIGGRLVGAIVAGGNVTGNVINVFQGPQTEPTTEAPAPGNIRLTEPGEGSLDSRRRVSHTELKRGTGGGDTEAVLKILADARLITTTEESVEVAHEALIREWPEMRGWLDDKREIIRVHRRLAKAAGEWEANRQDASYLYGGTLLTGVEEHLPEMRALLSLSAGEEAFITASQSQRDAQKAERAQQRLALLDAESKRAEEAEARQQEQAQTAANLRQRAMWLAVAGAVALVLAILAGWFGWQSNKNATEAENQAAAAQAAEAAAVIDRATAQAAATAVTDQNEKAEAELRFYQTTDPAERLAELYHLFRRPDAESRTKARHLFYSLPEIDQLPVLRVTGQPTQTAVTRELLPTFGDVNGIYYTSEKYLTPLLESVEDSGLKTELTNWLAARDAAKAEDYKTALEKYDALLAADEQNPALYLERARAQAELGQTAAALSDLNRVMELAQAPGYARSGALPVGPEFANREQMSKAVGHQMMAYELIAEYEANKSDYPALAVVELPTVITDPMGVPMVKIPKGKFKMGSNENSDEQPIREVDLAEYDIDQHEVTNAQYREFIEAGGYDTQDYWTEAGWQVKKDNDWSQPGYWEDSNFNAADQPVVGVSWYEAVAFCNWRGGSLPSEAQWEKAARGTDQRTYPWGEGIAAHLLNNDGIVGQTTPVGDYPAGVSPYGAYDLAGNAWEWTSSLFYPYPYQADGREELDGTNVRVLRGGSWGSYFSIVRAASRNYYSAINRNGVLGFRCLR